MMIVLIIMGILLMVTMYLSGDQIQRVKDKTVKESILAEWQSRYSRNLWSSSYAGKLYKYMDITLNAWSGEINFDYEPKNSDTGVNNIFKDNFLIKGIITNPWTNPFATAENITLRYTPYQISCEWWEKHENNTIDTWDMKNELLLIARVNDSRNYCFIINKNNCRLMEVSRDKCKIGEFLLDNQQE